MIPVLVGAAAAAVAGVTEWWWIRGGRYRAGGDQAGRDLRWSWLVIPAAIIGGAIAGLLGWSWLSVAAWLLVVAGAGIGWIDLDVHRIPNPAIAGLGAVVAVVLCVAVVDGGGWQLAVRSVAVAAVMAGLFVVLTVVGSMGLGDVKLAAVTGLVVGALGWLSVVVTVGASFAAAGVVGVVLLIGGARRSGHMAFGPALIVGAAVAIAQAGLVR